MNTYLYLALSLILMSGVSRLDCSGDADEPTEANIAVMVQVAVSGPGAAPCERNIALQLDPVLITGATGSKTTRYKAKDVTATPQLAGAQWVCRYNSSGIKVGALAVGTWTVRATSPGFTGAWSAECTEELVAGYNVFHFTVNQPGCTRGIGWPGDPL